jgi:hypothetical protein
MRATEEVRFFEYENLRDDGFANLYVCIEGQCINGWLKERNKKIRNTFINSQFMLNGVTVDYLLASGYEEVFP